MSHQLLAVLIAFAALGISCGDSNSTSTAPSTVSPPPAPVPSTSATANIVVGIRDATVTTAAGGGSTFRYTLTMRESNGVGSRINYVRLEIFTATGAFEERSEIGAGAIIAGTGDNVLAANGAETASVNMFFRSTIKKGRGMLLTVGFTDDNGHDLEATFPFTFT